MRPNFICKMSAILFRALCVEKSNMNAEKGNELYSKASAGDNKAKGGFRGGAPGARPPP